VRIALGAQRAQILGLIMRQGLTTVAVGLPAVFSSPPASDRVIASLLVGVSPYDPVTVAAVSTLLAVVAVAANLIPAIARSPSIPILH
jgi:putative ABC transport system permease protein